MPCATTRGRDKQTFCSASAERASCRNRYSQMPFPDLASTLKQAKGLVPLAVLRWLMSARTPLSGIAARAAPLHDLEGLGKVLVIAPHPDDETLGCGGLLALLSGLGLRPGIVIVTDGGAAAAGGISRDALVAIRREEALRALEILGLADDQVRFVALRDSELPRPGDPLFEEAAGRLSVAIRRDIDTVAVTWRDDPSPDHQATWLLLQRALSLLGIAPRQLEYPIWAWNERTLAGEPPFRPWRVDVRAVRTQKRRAIEAHRSQVQGLGASDSFRLPRSILAMLDQPYELFFESKG